MKLILYGIGQGLELVEEKIKDEHEIIGYADSFSNLKSFRGKPFYNLKDIGKIDCDYFILTICDRKKAWEIYELLSCVYNLHKEKIIPFYAYAKCELSDIKLKTYNLEEIQGLIFGNSHAAYGFLENELTVPFMNLAIPSADIYYNYMVFHKKIACFKNKFKNLKWVIIDMFDYNIFNYDASMAAHTFDYILKGGETEAHNFKFNHNFNNSFLGELFEKSYFPDMSKKYMHLFNDMNVEYDLCPMNRWKHIEKNELIRAEELIGSLVINRFDNTIHENKILIRKFLDEIRECYPHVKIVFTLIPRYINMEKLGEIFIKEWKDEFYQEMAELCNEYKAFFWDYKNKKEIAENSRFYYDVIHLNTTGGRALTSILNENLKNIIE